MTIDEMISFLEATGTPRHELAGKSADYLEHRVALRRRDGSIPCADAGYARATRYDDHPHTDGVDGELAALMKHFDEAPQILENYTLAEPWLYGEKAAMAAAVGAMNGHRRDATSHAAPLSFGASAYGADAELEQLARNFDAAPEKLEAYARADPWLHGEVAAQRAVADYVPAPVPSSALEAPASLERAPDPAVLEELRAKSERDPLSAFVPLSEFERLSAEQRAKLAEVVKATVASLLGQGAAQ